MRTVRIFAVIIMLVLCSICTSVSAKSAFATMPGGNNYDAIRQDYNLKSYNNDKGIRPNDYRQVYSDVKNNEFDIYWGERLKKINENYELKWGVWGTDTAYYILQLGKIYKRGSPHLILWFKQEKLYKIWMYFPQGINDDTYKKKVVNYLIQKLGTPAVYTENILMWKDETAKADSLEEQKLEKKFQHHINRHKKHMNLSELKADE